MEETRIKELAAVGTAAGIGKDICTEIAYDIEKCVKTSWMVIKRPARFVRYIY